MVGRNTSGVIIFRTGADEHVVSVDRLVDSGADHGEISPDADEAPEA
jgi:DNA gyrase subunit A